MRSFASTLWLSSSLLCFNVTRQLLRRHNSRRWGARLRNAHPPVSAPNAGMHVPRSPLLAVR
eukprot:241374-Amphidinium_carterae.1